MHSLQGALVYTAVQVGNCNRVCFSLLLATLFFSSFRVFSLADPLSVLHFGMQEIMFCK